MANDIFFGARVPFKRDVPGDCHVSSDAEVDGLSQTKGALLGLEMAQRQTQMLTTLLITLEEQGAVKLTRDTKGEITGGRAIELRATAQAKAGMSADLTTGTPTAAVHK